MQNIIVALFEVESEGYQALTELKQNPGTEKSFISQAALLKKENGICNVIDSFDTGANTTDDTVIGGLIGMCVGVLGGPIGVLLGGSMGALTGMSLDTVDVIDSISMFEQITEKLNDNDVAIIGLASEESPDVIDNMLSKYKAIIARFDAAVIAQEAAKAEELAIEMERQAKEELRKQHSDEFKDKVEAHRNKMKAQFEELKSKFK